MILAIKNKRSTAYINLTFDYYFKNNSYCTLMQTYSTKIIEYFEIQDFKGGKVNNRINCGGGG